MGALYVVINYVDSDNESETNEPRVPTFHSPRGERDSKDFDIATAPPAVPENEGVNAVYANDSNVTD